MRILVGTNPSYVDDFGPEGIWSASLAASSGEVSALKQAAELDSASFLALSPSHESVLAVSETENGKVVELSIQDGLLVKQQEIVTKGDFPCHLIISGTDVIVANYGTGSVFSHPLPLRDTHGEDSGVLYMHAGSGPVTDRQEGPHAHYIQKIEGTDYVWAVDLGADMIFKYAQTAVGFERDGVAVTFPAGAGPRHMALGAQGIAYVVGELDNHVYVVTVDPVTGVGEIIARFPILTEQVLATVLELGRGNRLNTPDTKASHIALSAAGDKLFVAVRGVDVMVAFSVLDNGNLEYVAHHDVMGEKPRHFAVVEGEAELVGQTLLIVANENSHSMDVLAFDTEQNVFLVLSQTSIPVPMCVLPLP